MKMEALVTGWPSAPLITPTRSRALVLAAAGAMPSTVEDEEVPWAGRLPGSEWESRLRAAMTPAARHAGNNQVRGRGCLLFMFERVTPKAGLGNRKTSNQPPAAAPEIVRTACAAAARNAPDLVAAEVTRRIIEQIRARVRLVTSAATICKHGLTGRRLFRWTRCPGLRSAAAWAITWRGQPTRSWRAH